MVLNKKGEWRGYILTAILGIIVVGISFYFIFSEYFTEDEIDWEACRQSLILRNMLPEKDLVVSVASSKSLLPMKCKTQVVTIDYKDLERAEKEISETISSCWYMIGRGEYKVFPGSANVFSGKETPCMICARIHLDREVRGFYLEDNKIDIERGLSKLLEGYDISIWDYLNPSRRIKAFMYFKEWDENGFNISPIYDVSWSGFDPKNTEAFSFPKYLHPEKGDFFIVYAEPIKEGFASDERAINPYMVLLQDNDFDKLSFVWASSIEAVDFATTFYSSKSSVKVCSSIETVPS